MKANQELNTKNCSTGRQKLFENDLNLAFGCHIWLPSCELFNKGAGAIFFLLLFHTYTLTHTHHHTPPHTFACVFVKFSVYAHASHVIVSVLACVCECACVRAWVRVYVCVDRAVFSLADRCTNYLSISLSTFPRLLPSIHTS